MAPKQVTLPMLRERATRLATWKVQVIVDRVMPVAPDPIPITAHPTKSVIGRMESLRLSLRLARRTPLAQRTLMAQGTLQFRRKHLYRRKTVPQMTLLNRLT